MMNHSVDIYYFPASPPCRATLLLMKALGIKENLKITNIMAGEQMTPEFLQINPMHTIPTINDGGFIMWDSHVVMKYLVDQYAKDDSLYPRDPKKGAVVTHRLFFDATLLYPRLADYCFPVLIGAQQPDPAKASKFEEALGYLDGFLKNQPWMAGQNITVADFAIIAAVSTAEAVNFEISKFPKLAEWYERAKNAMAGYGYAEINQVGADEFGAVFKSKLE